MKRVPFLACAFLLLSTVPSLAAIEVSGDAYVGVFDKYLWRGIDYSGGKPVVQGGMDLSLGQLSLGYWTNIQLADAPGLESGEGNETDLTIDYAIPVCPVATVNVGNTFYTTDGVEGIGGDKDTSELYVGVTVDTLLAPELKAYYDYDANRDDRFYTLSIGHSIEFPVATLNLGALAGYADNDEAHVPWNGELSVALDIPVTEQIQVNPAFLLSMPLSDTAKEVIDTELQGGITLTFAF